MVRTRSVCTLDGHRRRRTARGDRRPVVRNRPSDTIWKGKPDTYHAFQATLIPRLPLTPTLAAARRDGLLDQM